jgi:hypothetical protein
MYLECFVYTVVPFVYELSGLRKHWFRRFQVLVSPEQRTEQRHNCKTVAKLYGKKRKEPVRGKALQGKLWALPGGTEALISLLKPNF